MFFCCSLFVFSCCAIFGIYSFASLPCTSLSFASFSLGCLVPRGLFNQQFTTYCCELLVCSSFISFVGSFFTYLCIYFVLSVFFLSVFLSDWLAGCLFVCLSVYLSVFLLVYVSLAFSGGWRREHDWPLSLLTDASLHVALSGREESSEWSPEVASASLYETSLALVGWPCWTGGSPPSNPVLALVCFAWSACKALTEHVDAWRFGGRGKSAKA